MTTFVSSEAIVQGRRPLYTQQRFLFMTLDPVHIGTGGYRLGRVDMTIAREPGTNLPKIPGTSLAGATRSYAAMRYGKPDVAGQQKKFVREGQKEGQDCPIIYTFGTATDTGERQEQTKTVNTGEQQGQTKTINRAGTVSIGDAQILFFPVTSMAGPVWVSTTERVREAWGAASITLPEHREPTDDDVVTSLNWKGELNLGWLLFGSVTGLKITLPASLRENLKEIPEWDGIAQRIVLVRSRLFSQIVNSNLEVRTSVSIDPTTGAAESGALFTYEAIPRTTWLWSDIIEDDYRVNGDGASQFPKTDKQCKIEIKDGKKHYADNEGEPMGETWNRPLDVVKSGVKLTEYLGIGGMGTRGFGRMRLIADWEESNGGAQ